MSFDGWMPDLWAARDEQRIRLTSTHPCITRGSGTQGVNSWLPRDASWRFGWGLGFYNFKCYDKKSHQWGSSCLQWAGGTGEPINIICVAQLVIEVNVLITILLASVERLVNVLRFN